MKLQLKQNISQYWNFKVLEEILIFEGVLIPRLLNKLFHPAF